MAESKPTKIQMAKEAQKLIDAAQDMSEMMDLDPAIKTDYLIDLKNKTVTVASLQDAITALQTDIKSVAKEIEPKDKFEKETHEVLADLNVKVPQSNPEKEDAEEEEAEVAYDDLEKNADDEVEKEKPIKKVKKDTKDTKEKDEFGFAIGTKTSFFAQSLKESPKTMVEIKAEKWNDNSAAYNGTWAKLKRMGAGEKSEDGKMAIVSGWLK